MPIITTYYCSMCKKQILGIGETHGRMDNCPHCGAFLSGLNAQHVNDLTLFYIVSIVLTVFFIMASVAAPPSIIVGIGTGIWAYFLHKKRKAAKSGLAYQKNAEAILSEQIILTTLQRKRKSRLIWGWFLVSIGGFFFLTLVGATLFPVSELRNDDIIAMVGIILFFVLLILWGLFLLRKAKDIKIIPQVSSSSPQSEDDFVAQCLNPQFREQQELRTFKSDPEFSKVLDPLNRGNNDLACREAEMLISNISDFDGLYDWWGTALLRNNAFDQARQVLRHGLEKSRRKYSLCKVLGEVEWNAGNIQQATYWWTQALHSQELLERYGADEGAYLYLHYVADGIGLSGIARALISRVDQIRGGQVRLNPPTAENLRSLARKGKTSGIEKVVKELGAKYLDQRE